MVHASRGFPPTRNTVNQWLLVSLLLSLLVFLGGLLALGVGVFFATPLISVMTAGLYDELRLNDAQGGPVEFV